ncbi:peptidylprolyl isomerase [Pontibacillus yanchengensis]|uniref:Foldase protein PrsA n=1 Tax=Pontibacillus yanchengensis Y32 TaxID=1385514 RepID=A0A0A2T6S7_9BACI|nr:peptidylprolyl isomerase [Pontibacillus yanchengensis]KGP71204.1 peptidylprolyl isomerase [Pontibacillus yanchengensis Y32]
MKNKLAPIVMTVVAAFTLTACSNGSAEDAEVVASTKNGDVSKEEFYNKLVDQYGDAVLKEMIYEKVLSENYSVSEKEVQAEIDKMKESYGDQFQSVLQQNGFSSEDDLKDVIHASMLKEKAATDGVEVSEEEVQSYYDNMKQEVQASHILVDDEKTAKDVIQKLEDGGDFAELAKEHSTDTTSAENGGDLGYFSTGDMVLPFEEAAYNLEVGKVSKPVESEYGYHIIKVTDKREKEDTSSIGSFDEMKEQLQRELETRKANPDQLTEIMNEAKIDIKNADLKEKISF